MCNKCGHREVCGKYRATGGVKSCEHFRLERRGRWLEFTSFMTCSECDTDWYYVDNDCDRFDHCPNCGADMRGAEDMKESGRYDG